MLGEDIAYNRVTLSVTNFGSRIQKLYKSRSQGFWFLSDIAGFFTLFENLCPRSSSQIRFSS